MAFYKFTGSSPEFYATIGLTAQPGYVYDFGIATPPPEPILIDGVNGALTKWASDPGPATDFILHGRQASDITKSLVSPSNPRYRVDTTLPAPLIANNCWGNGQITQQTVAGTSRSRHLVVTAACDIRLVYVNYGTLDPGTNGVDTDGTGAVDVKASVEFGGAIYRATFGGQANVTIGRGGVAVSDPIGLELPAGTTLYVRSYTASTAWYPASASFAAAGSGGWTASDLTEPGSAAIADSTHWLLSPSAIVGTPTNRSLPTVGIMGDSIAAGTNDLGGASGNNGANAYTAWGNTGVIAGGYIARALTLANLPWINTAHASERAYTYVLPANHYRRLAMLNGCSSVICEYGRNDIVDGQTLAQVQASLISCWQLANRRGASVFQTTITPSTTSSDSWATVGNQTVTSVALNAVRVALNNWIRAGAPMSAGVAVAVGAAGALVAGQAGHPLTGYIDAADLAESTRDSGLWKANYTADGAHPNSAAATAMSTGLNISALV